MEKDFSIKAERGELLKYCGNEEIVSIPTEVKLIASTAFDHNDKVKHIRIPKTVCYIKGNPFNRCTSLVAIEVDAENKYFSSEDGILYSKDKKTLLCCPCGKAGKVLVPDSVVSIAEKAFYRCSSLTEIELPKHLETIGLGAFGRSGIHKIQIPAGVVKLREGILIFCSNLKEVVLSDNLRFIEDYAFAGCNSLKTILIPRGVVSVGNLCFAYCSALQHVTLPLTLQEIGTGAFAYCKKLTQLRIPGSVTKIDRFAFLECSKLKNVELSEGLKSLGTGAFMFCTSLEQLILPEGLTSAGARILDGSSARSIYLPESLEKIEENTFLADHLDEFLVAVRNPAFTSVDGVLYTKDLNEIVRWPGAKAGVAHIPSYIKNIWDDAFSGCSQITDIVVDQDNSEYRSKDGALIANCLSELIYVPDNTAGSIIVPKSINFFASSAFSGCASVQDIFVEENHSLYVSVDGILYNKDYSWLLSCPPGRQRNITIASEAVGIYERAFQNCSKLEHIVIPEGITTIKYKAFSMCSALKCIVFPSTLKKIDDYIIDCCNSLEVVVLPSHLKKEIRDCISKQLDYNVKIYPSIEDIKEHTIQY